jgi:hypothetical protein
MNGKPLNQLIELSYKGRKAGDLLMYIECYEVEPALALTTPLKNVEIENNIEG